MPVLVGGTAAVQHAVPSTTPGIASIDGSTAALEETTSSDRRGCNPPDGVETGVRNLIRRTPLGPVRLPEIAKAWLCLLRNAPATVDFGLGGPARRFRSRRGIGYYADQLGADGRRVATQVARLGGAAAQRPR